MQQVISSQAVSRDERRAEFRDARERKAASGGSGCKVVYLKGGDLDAKEVEF